jgi:DNA-binding HxlR family transcriptional regulator
MVRYGQFCPVAKAAEIIADRWTPLIIRELCFGPCTFGQLLFAMPLISRTMLTQRLKELASSETVAAEPKAHGRGHLYRLTGAGEDLRPLIEMMSEWGQRWTRERIEEDDLDPALLMWGMSRQIDPAEIPAGRTVIRFEFRGLPQNSRSSRYWWYVIQRHQIEVCLKNPGYEADAIVPADLACFSKLWLGYIGLDEARANGQIEFHGSAPAITLLCRLLRLPTQRAQKKFRFAPFPDRVAASTVAAQ